MSLPTPATDILDLLARIPVNASTILEVNRGAPSVVPACRARQPLAKTIQVGPDLDPIKVAALPALIDVVVLNRSLQDIAKLQAHTGAREQLDALRRRVRPGGLLVADFENAAHWSQIRRLLGGQSTDRSGTLQEYARSLESAGWTLLDATPSIVHEKETEAALSALLASAQPLGLDPQHLRRDLMADRWIIRAINGPAPVPMSIAALGLRKMAGVTEARVDHPLQALNSLPEVRAVWSSSQLKLPPDWPPGVLILHRQFMNHDTFNSGIERLVARGWTLVADMDDDPHHWKEYPASGFRAFRGVHAVTVSTPALAEMMRRWNPQVAVFPNAVTEVQPVEPTSPKTRVPRIFFGALNRGADWAPLQLELRGVAQQLGSSVEWVVVHDRAFFDMLPPEVPKIFHPTLPPQDYQAQLRACDISLLPLADTPFNRLKSDLKFIESCAAAAVPICSETVYAERSEHRDIGVFATAPHQWADALLSLCRNPTELARRRQLGLDYVQRERMMGQQAEPRLRFYRDLLDRRFELESQRQARLRELDSQARG